MAVSTITLDNGEDSVVVSDQGLGYIEDDIILVTDPKGMYDTGFKIRTQSGAFETGGRIVGIDVPIREPVLPFLLTKASRPRFQKLWGTPYNLKKVTCTWNGPSGPRSLVLKLSKEILYTTEDGFDVKDDDDDIHAVVSALAVNPMYEGEETVAQWVNPDDRFNVAVVGTGGTYTLTFGGQTTNDASVGIVATGGTYTLTFGGQTTSALAWNASTATVQTALQALSSVGAGNAIVSGSASSYFVIFKVAGTLTGSGTSLTGTSHSLTVTSGIPYNASTATIQSALESLSSVGAGKVTVTGTSSAYLVVFAVGTNGVLTGSATNLTGTGHKITIDYAPNTGWFSVWNPTDQPLWLEWDFDPAEQWKFPDFSFGQERKWGRTVGEDAARLIVTVPVTSELSVMSDPFQDTYVVADLSNFAGLMNGVEPMYQVPPYTGTEADPILEPVICFGPAGATATLRQRRFWSAESGLEQ
jgi:hypothetical protein